MARRGQRRLDDLGERLQRYVERERRLPTMRGLTRMLRQHRVAPTGKRAPRPR